jgi:hypothetical protein
MTVVPNECWLPFAFVLVVLAFSVLLHIMDLIVIWYTRLQGSSVSVRVSAGRAITRLIFAGARDSLARPHNANYGRPFLYKNALNRPTPKKSVYTYEQTSFLYRSGLCARLVLSEAGKQERDEECAAILVVVWLGAGFRVSGVARPLTARLEKTSRNRRLRIPVC